MNFRIKGLISFAICGAVLGCFWLAPSWYGTIELLGISLFIGCIAIPLQDRSIWLSKFRSSLFWGGSLLTFFSTFWASPLGFNSVVGWLMVICLWTALGITSSELSGLLNRYLFAFLLYGVFGLSFLAGYISQPLFY